MQTLYVLMGFVSGAVLALAVGGLVARNTRQREEATVRLLSALQAGLTEAAASGEWPIRMAALPESRAGSGELIVWDLLRNEPRALASTPRACETGHRRLLLSALDAGGELHRKRVAMASGRQQYGLAVVVEQQGDPALVSTFFRERDFSEREIRWATALGRIMGDSVAIVLAQRRSAVLSELVDAIERAGEAREVMEVVTEALASEMTGMLATVLRYDGGVFRPYALAGVMSEELRRFFEEGLEPYTGLAWEAHRTGEVIFLEQYPEHPAAAPTLVELGIGPVAVLPLDPRPGSRTILVVAGCDPHRWRAHDRELIERVRQILRVVLDLRYTEERLDAVVRLERELVVTEASEMPHRLVDAAVSMVPGAETGSLLVRDGDVFRYVAYSGSWASVAADVPFTEQDVLRWYASDEESFRSGKPRLAVAAGSETLVEMMDGHGAAQLPFDDGAPVANLVLPVVDQGEVMALLNLDSLTDRNAFGPEALEVLRAFQPLIAFVLRDAEQRQLLTANATTDSLTGLPNRRAFDEQAERAVAVAERYDTTLALLVMDMRGFKAINDTYGHRKGDEVLKSVAEALSTVPRVGDVVFRWGGDEFSALLRSVDAAEAVRVGERFAEQVREIDLLDTELGINVGVALYPDDAGDLATLLEVADARMYVAKSTGITVVARDGPVYAEPGPDTADGPGA